MAKQFTPKQRRVRKAMITAAATVGVSSALVLVNGTNAVDALVELTATNHVIGIGGRGDATSSNIPAKLGGTVPNGYDYVPIPYPAGYDLGRSSDVGVPVLDDALGDHSTDQSIHVVGYSEGTLVAEKERRNLQAMPAIEAPSRDQLSFTQIASPFAGNGGIFGRFAAIPTFVIVNNMGPAQPTRYDTNYVVNEYDPYGDFPAYANPLSLANTALAIEYAHPDQYYDSIQPGVTPTLGDPYVVHNAQGGTDTYTIYYNDHLPLLAPIREAAAAAHITPYVEPELGLIEPTLRVFVDMGYTDRENLDPVTPTRFSLITPPEKIIGAAQALPGAIQEGIRNFVGSSQAIAPLNATSPNRSNAPAVSGLPHPPANLPKQPTLPKFDPPKHDPLKIDAPKRDALKLPKPPFASRQPTARPDLSNLGSLVNGHLRKPTVLAGGGAPAGNPPTFGGGRPAGAFSNALKNIGGLTGGLNAGKSAPATTP